jgi:CRISPR-associated protein Csx17
VNNISLQGCRPVPLAHYLKALGVLRLISEQIDPSACGNWHRDTFVLTTSLDESALLNFFLNEYCPTSVAAPWNGGSGFFPKDNAEALTAIESGTAERMSAYRGSISGARQALKEVGLKEKPTPETKESLLLACRNTLPDEALVWLDAVFVLSDDGAKYPPLLGTGGNDGRLEFTNNFMQRLGEVMDPATGTATLQSEKWLRSALFAEPVSTPLSKAPVGQFFPGAAGGANATSGFDAPSAVNPWDYILMIEGALLFAAASVKRLESANFGQMVYPFCVRQAGVGYASAAPADETAARAEMWMPLWNQPTTLAELKSVFGEGRAQVGGRPARNGVDFARAVVTLGVDRGLTEFQRYGFQVRNGLAYFATPLERVKVHRNPQADLLSEIDSWLDRLRQKAGPQANPPAPASVSRAFNQLEDSILALCRKSEGINKSGAAVAVFDVLIALGSCQKALARSFKWSTESANLRPLSRLSPKWLEAAYHGAPRPCTFRLAASIASLQAPSFDKGLPFRNHLEPVEAARRGEFKWRENASNDVVWHESNLPHFLNAVITRRLALAEKSVSDVFHGKPRCSASLADIAEFIDDDTDDELFANLLWALSLIDWLGVEPEEIPWKQSADTAGSSGSVPALYAIMKLCFVQAGSSDNSVPLTPVIHRRALLDNSLSASELAVRRLRGSGYFPALDDISVSKNILERIAASLLFPLSEPSITQLREAVLRQPQIK